MKQEISFPALYHSLLEAERSPSLRTGLPYIKLPNQVALYCPTISAIPEAHTPYASAALATSDSSLAAGAIRESGSGG